jgi:hypothetical protein
MTLPPGLIQPSRPDQVLGLEGQIVGNILLTDGLAALDDDRASFLGDVTHRQQPGLASVPGGSHVDLGAPRSERVAGRRHGVLPADQPADTTERKRMHRQIAPVPAAPDEALTTGGSQLPVLPENRAVRSDVEQRIEEGGVTCLRVPLVHANRDGDCCRSGRAAETLRGAARNGDRVRVLRDIGLAQIRRTARRDELHPHRHRISRHECFREHDQVRVAPAGLFDKQTRCRVSALDRGTQGRLEQRQFGTIQAASRGAV